MVEMPYASGYFSEMLAAAMTSNRAVSSSASVRQRAVVIASTRRLANPSNAHANPDHRMMPPSEIWKECFIRATGRSEIVHVTRDSLLLGLAGFDRADG
jgi:hypothetical protein